MTADLINSIAEHHLVDENRVAVGNGTDELILMLALARRTDHRPALITSWTFQSYPKSLREVGIPIVEQPLEDYRISAKDVCRQLDQGVGLAVVCNSHNPQPEHPRTLVHQGIMAEPNAVFGGGPSGHRGPAMRRSVSSVMAAA